MVKRNNKNQAKASKGTKTNKKSNEEIIKDAKNAGEYPPTAQVEVVEQSEDRNVKDEPTNELPITPEVVELEKPEEQDVAPIVNVSEGLHKLANGDRIDHNRAIDLMGMIHKEFVSNPATPPELGKAMKGQFDAMALVELMYYNAQVQDDLQQLGIKINKDQFVQIEKIAREMFGITLKGLPDPKSKDQLIINFSEAVKPEQVATAKDDLRATKEVDTIPMPDANMPEKEKEKVIRAIFSKTGGGVGNNFYTAIEFARKAYKFDEKEKVAVILASLLQKDFRTTLTNGITSMVKGRLNHDHSIIGAHAILHKWLPKYSNEDIAEIVQVCLSYKEEANCKDYAEKTGRKTDIEKSLSLINQDVVVGMTSKVIDGIIKKSDQVVVNYPNSETQVAIATDSIYNTLNQVYGDSENLLKDIVNTISKCYSRPIVRLSKYVDKSAYSK